jgi:hypothetical protein
VAFPVSGHRQRVDRIHRPSSGPQGGDQQATWGFDRHGHRVLDAVAGTGEQFDQLGEPGGIVGNAFLGDQLSVAVDDRDVVVAFRPVDAAEQFHVYLTSLLRVFMLVTGPGQDAQHSTYEAQWPSLR